MIHTVLNTSSFVFPSHLVGADGGLIELAGALGDVGGAELVSGEVAVAAPGVQFNRHFFFSS